MKAVIGGESSRERVRRAWDSMATPGQNVSSKRKKTFRRAMMRLRWAKAHVRTPPPISPSPIGSRGRASASELNEHLLQIGLTHAAVPHLHALLLDPGEQVGQPLLH